MSAWSDLKRRAYVFFKRRGGVVSFEEVNRAFTPYEMGQLDGNGCTRFNADLRVWKWISS